MPLPGVCDEVLTPRQVTMAREPLALESREVPQAAKRVEGAPKMIDGAEVAKHNDVNSTWVVISGVVYDVTDFLQKHVRSPLSPFFPEPL